ncbi:MAG: SurA N-terminal domain-containing protein [Rubrivivax sp.]|nr:SurA N-terminal domain-containing protein [Rubrivivax sp.]
MFDFIRTHIRLTMGFILLLIIPSFVFFGIDGYSKFSEQGNVTVAKVDGNSITRAEWDQAHQRNIERLRRQMPTLDVKLLDTPEMKRESLDGLVRDRVLLAAASQLHLMPSDGRLQRLFTTDPQFAGLRNPDGSVNRDLLAAQGMSSEMFAQQLRQDFAMRQVLAAIGQTTLVPASTAAASLDALLQRREVQLQRFDSAAYRAQVQPTEAEIEAYHRANEAQFRSAEQATIEYAQLDLDALMKGVTVPEEDLRRYYDENAARYTSAEERRASHILIKADREAAAADRQKAKAKAEALLADLRKNPAGFAEAARKNSDDPGSATQGGDLDFFGRGSMVKAFEDTVFAMKAGEISSIVETDFGFHIITLTATRGGARQTFESKRAEIEAEVRKSLAQKRYAEAAEQFSNTVYEQPDSLQPVIDKLKLDKRSATVLRTPAPGATGALASAKLLDAVFGTDAVRNKRNTDAVEVAPNQLVSARIVEHKPARTLPLAEVKDAVRERVVAAQAAALARKEGQARLLQIQQGSGMGLPVTATVSRNQPQGLAREVLDAALRADPAKLPAAVGVDLGEQGFVVLRVTQVLPRETTPAEDGQLRVQYAQALAGAEAHAYLEALKQRFKVELKSAVIAAAAASAPTP